MGYYFIDYCPQCGGGYKVCRTSSRYEYSVNKNWHNVDTVNIWSFDNYQSALNFAKSRSDKIGPVEVSERTIKQRGRDVVNKHTTYDVVKFPITQRRGLNDTEKGQREIAQARRRAMDDALYFIGLYDSKKKAIEAITANKKYWAKKEKAYNDKERGYVA